MNGCTINPHKRGNQEASIYIKKSSMLYLFSVGTLVLAVMYLGLYDIGKVSRTNYLILKKNIRDPWPPFSWLGSKGMDITDPQWYNLTVAIPFLAPFFALFLYISKQLRCKGGNRDNSKLYILHIFSGMFIGFGISGFCFIYAIMLFIANYYGLAKLHNKVSYIIFMSLMWGIHIGFLFLNNYFKGYGFKWIGLEFLEKSIHPLIQWYVHYNMGVLRMIAFNTDMHEAFEVGLAKREIAIQKHDISCLECAKIRESNIEKYQISSDITIEDESLRCYKFRTEYPRELREYNLLSYLGYLFYPPLYIAGPMSSFNAYISHLQNPTRAIDSISLRRYGLRTSMNFLLLIFMMHYNYITAILISEPVFTSISFSRRSLVLYLTLGFLWLKFNCIWKLFRFLSILDGVDVPEDMRRCFTNIVSIQNFWRDWHASFNLWIVRYMYIPMGGNKKKHLNIFPIFFFIAIWHDVDFRLFFWAGAISICFAFEILVTHIVFNPKSHFFIFISRRPIIYLFLRITGSVFVMTALIIINLVGFSIGVGRAGKSIAEVLNESPISFRIILPIFMYMASLIATQDRDQEEYEKQKGYIKYGLINTRVSKITRESANDHNINDNNNNNTNNNNVTVEISMMV